DPRAARRQRQRLVLQRRAAPGGRGPRARAAGRQQLDRHADRRPRRRHRRPRRLLRLLDGGHRHRARRARGRVHQGARRGAGGPARRGPRADGAGMSRVLGRVARGAPPVHALMSIGGRWREATSGARMDCIDPTTEELLGTVPAAGAADADLAVRTAQEASGPWRALGWTKRAALLRDLAAAVAEVADRLAVLDTLDSGNPIAGMRGDIDSTVRELHYYAGLAGQTHGESTPTGAETVSFTRREPYGVVVRIVPFNHPFKFACGKAAAALAAGNAVIVKPGEQTSLSAIALAEIAEAVLPPGVLTVLTGTGTELGEALVGHPGVQRVAFTGSVPTGRRILTTAARNLAHVTLELGGKNPLIVCPDVDPRTAARDAVASMNIARSNGQSC